MNLLHQAFGRRPRQEFRAATTIGRMDVDGEEQTGKLPAHLEKARTRVGIGFKKLSNPVGTYGARTYESLGFDNSLDLATFFRECVVHVKEKSDEELVFDLVGVDAPIANALRRILLAEVPTMAIETVFVHDNSSVMHDEMLAHRLGLVPLLIDPAPFKTWRKGEKVTYENTVKFRLKVACEHAASGPRDAHAPPETLYENAKVLSKSIGHVPMPRQAALLRRKTPRPVHDDILLTKLRPGQAIHVEMNATKGIGREHAKWSPVATASYRMLPEITIRRPLRGPEAAELKDLCPMNVFDIEDGCAKVARPRQCTMCRECVRGPERAEKVELTRKRDHFIFDVESAGQMPSSRLVVDALSVLIGKCDTVEKALDEALQRRAPDEIVRDAEVEDMADEEIADEEMADEEIVDEVDAEDKA